MNKLIAALIAGFFAVSASAAFAADPMDAAAAGSMEKSAAHAKKAHKATAHKKAAHKKAVVKKEEKKADDMKQDATAK